jgi:adenosylcobinamide kinase/adenosylcobinamide-phosphate guanylyltransferase
MIVFITGGVKSGKSYYALQCADRYFGDKCFLATGVAFDDEMRERIRKHQEQRDESYRTVEEPVEIDTVEEGSIILDDITVWMNNLFYYKREEEWEVILDRFLENLGSRRGSAIIVSNETGLGNIPLDPETRKFNRYLGAANVKLACAADRVYFMVSGIPLLIKPALGTSEAEDFREGQNG